jgi:hypothetical protein
LIGANFTFPLKTSASETIKLMALYYGQVEKDVILDITSYYKEDMALFDHLSNHHVKINSMISKKL